MKDAEVASAIGWLAPFAMKLRKSRIPQNIALFGWIALFVEWRIALFGWIASRFRFWPRIALRWVDWADWIDWIGFPSVGLVSGLVGLLHGFASGP